MSNNKIMNKNTSYNTGVKRLIVILLLQKFNLFLENVEKFSPPPPGKFCCTFLKSPTWIFIFPWPPPPLLENFWKKNPPSRRGRGGILCKELTETDQLTAGFFKIY